MKTIKTILLLIPVLLLFSCATPKSDPAEKLFGSTWELEYISGPRITFDGLYPDRKPQFVFNQDSQMVEGHNSCNGYMARYEISGDSISFGEPGPTTMMFCGEGENVFLSAMRDVNRFEITDEGKLVLLMGDVPMMRFVQAAPDKP